MSDPPERGAPEREATERTAAERGAAAARLLDATPGARLGIRLAVAAGVVEAVALVGAAFLVAVAIERVFLGGDDLAAVAPLLAAAAGAVAIRAMLAAAGVVAARRAARTLVSATRRQLTGRLVEEGPAFAAHDRSADLAGLLGEGMERLEAYVASYLPARSLAIAVPAVVLLVVLVVDPPTTLVLLLTGPVLLLLLAVVGSRTRSASRRREAELRWLGRFFLDVLRGLPTLKLFGRSREQTGNLEEIGERYSRQTMAVLRSAFKTSLVLEWSAAIAMALVAVEVGLRLLAGAIPFERALAVLIIAPEFFAPLRRLAARYHEGSEGDVVADHVDRALSTDAPAGPITAGTIAARPPAATSRAATDPPAIGIAAPPTIRFERVSFTYAGRDRPALDALELTLPAGSSTAIVGPTGAGKTTAAMSLLRFITPASGHITADGVDIATIDPSVWRRAIAWVPQRPHLFHGTVADNIRLGDPSAGDDVIATAVAAADAEAFVARLPRGLDTPLGEDGIRLSAGQRQRIAIARAFVRDAHILVMDEPTSHQDEDSEAAVAESLRALARDRTVLIVSHRARFAEAADRVVVLDAGRVVASGTPVELQERDGPWRRLLARGGDGAEA